MSNFSNPVRLTRLLAYVDLDPGNLALRIDAIREASNSRQWETARSLIDAGMQTHPDEASLLALSGLVHLQTQHYVSGYETGKGVISPVNSYLQGAAYESHVRAITWQSVPADASYWDRYVHGIGNSLGGE